MKIGIVGAGQVGSTAAYSLVLQGIGSEIVLVDHKPELAHAQVMDILHATPLTHPLRIVSGSMSDLQACSLVVVAAGVSQQPGESRLALLQRNAAIFADIIPAILQAAPEAILLIASNPLDIMTQLASEYAIKAGARPGQVFGSGTILDSARFRSLLAREFSVSAGSVHAYVLGEHGDSEVLAWSCASVAGIPLEQFAAIAGKPLDQASRQRIDSGVRRAAYEIIAGKGATCYGIGAAIASLCRAVLFDEKSVYTVCAMTESICGINQVALSLPHIVGRNGVQSALLPPLNAAELTELSNSASLLKTTMDSLRS